MGPGQETLEISEQTEALGSAMVRDGLLEEEVPRRPVRLAIRDPLCHPACSEFPYRPHVALVFGKFSLPVSSSVSLIMSFLGTLS